MVQARAEQRRSGQQQAVQQGNTSRQWQKTARAVTRVMPAAAEDGAGRDGQPRHVGHEATRCWRLACAPGGAGGRPGGRACDEWSMRVLLCVKKSNYICAVSVDGGGRAFEPLSEALTDPWGHALKMSTVRTARNWLANEV